jgi:predicted MFS family arabinose efflux permease
MATVMSAFPLASVLGVPTGLWLAHLFKWHAPFFLLGTLSGIILLVAWRILPHVHSHRSTEHPVRQMVAMLSLPVHQRCLLLSVALVFAGGSLIPFMAPSMVLNVGLSESQLPLIYFFGGACTFFTMPWVGRLADRHEKLHVLGWLTLCSALMALVITNLPVTPLPLVLTATSLFFISMTGRFAPAMAMITNAVEARYRGGFMSVNSAVQQAAAGLANLTAGALMTQNAAGRLIGYPRAGLVALVFFVLTFLLALRLRRLAPHASQPGGRQLTTPPMPVD